MAAQEGRARQMMYDKGKRRNAPPQHDETRNVDWAEKEGSISKVRVLQESLTLRFWGHSNDSNDESRDSTAWLWGVAPAGDIPENMFP